MSGAQQSRAMQSPCRAERRAQHRSAEQSRYVKSRAEHKMEQKSALRCICDASATTSASTFDFPEEVGLASAAAVAPPTTASATSGSEVAEGLDELEGGVDAGTDGGRAIW
jgi:hypothetical protein